MKRSNRPGITSTNRGYRGGRRGRGGFRGGGGYHPYFGGGGGGGGGYMMVPVPGYYRGGRGRAFR